MAQKSAVLIDLSSLLTFGGPVRCTTLFLPEDFGRPVNFPRGDKPIPEGVARRGLVSGAGESKGVVKKTPL